MGKIITFCILTIILALIAGVFPHVAVGLTAIVITILFLVFGKNY